MNKEKIIYWMSTGFIAFVMGFSAYNFAFNEEQQLAFQKLGLPLWFKYELTVAKLLGTIVILIPRPPRLIKDFTYFGFSLTIISADVAHLSSGDPYWYILPHLFMLGLLMTSYIYRERLYRVQTA